VSVVDKVTFTVKVVCPCCERPIEDGEQTVPIEVNGERARVCMPCVERIFREQFPTVQ
jgi:hypothetical protein